MKRIVLNLDDITVNQALDEFIAYKMSLKKSDDTIRYYKQTAYHFEKYIDSFDEIDFSFNSSCDTLLNEVIFQKYRTHLINKNIADATINNRLRGLKVFINFCIKKKYIEYFEMDLIKAVKKVKVTYTTDELKKLFEKPKKNASFTEYRNWVMVQLFYATRRKIKDYL